LKTPLPKPAGLEDVPRTYSRYGIKEEWLLADLKKRHPPDIILITSLMTYWYPGVQATIAVLREVWPAVPILLGGIYATLCRDHAEMYSGVDQVVAGPGVGQILDLVARYTGATIPPRMDLQSLDVQPFPALDRLSGIGFAPLLTSLGCPFKCDYCASSFLYPCWTVQAPERTFAEILHWHHRFGVKDFAFYDDGLLVNAPQRLEPLLKRVLEAGVKLRFHTPNAVHIREITADLAALMFKAGFHTLRLGLESAEPEDRLSLDQKVSYEEFERAAAYLLEAGFSKSQLGAYLLVGLPGQSLDAIKLGISTVHRHGITPIPAYYTPIPHTALWPRAVDASRYDLAGDPIFANNAVFPCWDHGFTWETLGKIRNWVRGER
jgi:radical SAM superfamily enzyme YgiQ (UPF0313 family)